jgi:hypothetical protein
LALILAIIPLDQVAIDFRDCSKPGELASPSGALQGTRENFGESYAFQAVSQAASVALPCFRQRQVYHSRVLTCDRPGCLSVPGQVNDRKFLADSIVSVHPYYPAAIIASWVTRMMLHCKVVSFIPSALFLHFSTLLASLQPDVRRWI